MCYLFLIWIVVGALIFVGGKEQHGGNWIIELFSNVKPTKESGVAKVVFWIMMAVNNIGWIVALVLTPGLRTAYENDWKIIRSCYQDKINGKYN